MNTHMPEISEQDLKVLLGKLNLLKAEIQKVIIGQSQALEYLIISFLAGGHSLLEGVPGLAKTLMIRTLAEAIDLQFKRIQFTPDLMPSDITGTEIIEEDPESGRRRFKFNPGPVFANIVLADEINRTPPKTQAALLEAMQEYEVSYGGTTYSLPAPFFILATQNPIEQSGTFPLPEAQLDRFLLYIQIHYPDAEEEYEILKATTGEKKSIIEPVLKNEEIVELQKLVRQVFISDELIRYVSRLVRETRPSDSSVESVKTWAQWGAGPRAGQALILTAKARALFRGLLAVQPEDIQAMCLPVFRHRILLNFRAEAEAISVDQLSQDILAHVKPS